MDLVLSEPLTANIIRNIIRGNIVRIESRVKFVTSRLHLEIHGEISAVIVVKLLVKIDRGRSGHVTSSDDRWNMGSSADGKVDVVVWDSGELIALSDGIDLSGGT